MRIYFIDDDSEEQELFSAAVEKIDNTIELLSYDNVKIAFDTLLNDPVQPDAVFLDLNMPQVSGKELLKMLRANTATKNIPVVIYSTTISKMDVDDTADYKVAYYLEKPDNFTNLCAKISETLNALKANNSTGAG